VHPREAWRRQYATQREPWRGPVHAAPLLEGLTGRVVELGAGGGKVGRALPPDALAVDWVREALPEGRAAVVADAAMLPLRDASVDALVAVHVLGHLLAAGRERAACEWARVLRPGGALVVEAFAAGDAREGSGTEVEAGTWVRGGIATHHFAEGELDMLLGVAGFTGAFVLEERRARWGVRRVWRGRLACAQER
jgi:SAM-dependent methyltransferase